MYTIKKEMLKDYQPTIDQDKLVSIYDFLLQIRDGEVNGILYNDADKQDIIIVPEDGMLQQRSRELIFTNKIVDHSEQTAFITSPWNSDKEVSVLGFIIDKIYKDRINDELVYLIEQEYGNSPQPYSWNELSKLDKSEIDNVIQQAKTTKETFIVFLKGSKILVKDDDHA